MLCSAIKPHSLGRQLLLYEREEDSECHSLKRLVP